LSRQIGIVTQSISQLNHDYTSLSTSLAVLQERVEWLCKFFWIVIGASIASFLSSIWNIIIQKKNGKDK